MCTIPGACAQVGGMYKGRGACAQLGVWRGGGEVGACAEVGEHLHKSRSICTIPVACAHVVGACSKVREHVHKSGECTKVGEHVHNSGWGVGGGGMCRSRGASPQVEEHLHNSGSMCTRPGSMFKSQGACA